MMQDEREVAGSIDEPGADGGILTPDDRIVLYLIDDRRLEVSDATVDSLGALRSWAGLLVAVVRSGTDEASSERLAQLADVVIVHDGEMTPAAYATALRELGSRAREAKELVFTGNSWYGPVRPLEPVLARMDRAQADVWQMVDNVDGDPESFWDEGFPGWPLSWLWVAVRRGAVGADIWEHLWREPVRNERAFVDALRAAGARCESAFSARDYPRGDPALFAPDLLMDDGFPFLSKNVFAQYPPFLDRHAVLGREVLRSATAGGYSHDLLLHDLARNVPPKALNTIGGMLEVVPDERVDDDPGSPLRLAVVVYVPEVAFIEELYARLAHVPAGFDLVITTGDGGRARAIEMAVASWPEPRYAHFETRVSWVRRGRDKAALFIACRDLLLGDDYDLIMALHGRESTRKTQNMQTYFSRYQLDNLVNSAGYVENVLAMFQREPGLGLVFPPMIHVGNAVMGRGWGAYREVARELCERMGVRVPFDRVSPLAPYGGMWIGRPAALRPLARERWTDNDYGKIGSRKYIELGRVQERLIPLVAAESGYHCRTILTSEHAGISHTAVEYKADQLFSTTLGYPVEQIRFMHRAGFTGHGGVVALTRMYLRLNNPQLARRMLPLYRLLFRSFSISQSLRDSLRRALGKDGA
jgi:lipopolysaccharide biosynthesis protein